MPSISKDVLGLSNTVPKVNDVKILTDNDHLKYDIQDNRFLKPQLRSTLYQIPIPLERLLFLFSKEFFLVFNSSKNTQSIYLLDKLKPKIKTKNHNIFELVWIKIWQLFYTLWIGGTRKQQERKRFCFLKCITKSKCY